MVDGVEHDHSGSAQLLGAGVPLGANGPPVTELRDDVVELLGLLRQSGLQRGGRLGIVLELGDGGELEDVQLRVTDAHLAGLGAAADGQPGFDQLGGGGELVGDVVRGQAEQGQFLHDAGLVGRRVAAADLVGEPLVAQ